MPLCASTSPIPAVPPAVASAARGGGGGGDPAAGGPGRAVSRRRAGAGRRDTLAGFARHVVSYLQADDAADGSLLAFFTDADTDGDTATPRTRPPTERPAPRTRPPSASVPAVHGLACSRNSNLPSRPPECRCGTPGLSAPSSGATHTAVIRSAADRRAGRSSRSGTAGSTRKWCSAAAGGRRPGRASKHAGFEVGGSGGACGGVRLDGAIFAAPAGQCTVCASARRLDHGPAVSQHPGTSPRPGTGRPGPRNRDPHEKRARDGDPGTSAERAGDPGAGADGPGAPGTGADGSGAPATMDWPLELPPELAGYLRASLCIASWRDALLVMAAAGRPAAERGAEDFGIFDTESGSGPHPVSRPGPTRSPLPGPAVPCAGVPGPGRWFQARVLAPSPATGRSCSGWRPPFRTGP